jgi:hypothetical protein
MSHYDRDTKDTLSWQEFIDLYNATRSCFVLDRKTWRDRARWFGVSLTQFDSWAEHQQWRV